MKKISVWAMRHPKQARLWIAGIKIFLFFEAWYIGNQLGVMGLRFSGDAFYFILLLFGIAVLTYPDKKNKKVYFSYRYYIRKKINDFIVALSSFIMLIVAFNTELFSPLYNAAAASSVAPEPIHVYNTNPGSGERKITAKEKRQVKLQLKKQLKRLMVTVRGNKEAKNKGVKFTLAILSGIVLMVVIAALACAIACNGQEVLAVIVLVLGLAGIICGLTAWIKSIYRKRETTRRKRKPHGQDLAMNVGD
ncbi:MAG: hypothetical protein KF746_12780 [Chitinophagaceae bacterium]|nr:hypothetical protein [Chitinophagaceae bacterium]